MIQSYKKYKLKRIFWGNALGVVKPCVYYYEIIIIRGYIGRGHKKGPPIKDDGLRA